MLAPLLSIVLENMDSPRIWLINNRLLADSRYEVTTERHVPCPAQASELHWNTGFDCGCLLPAVADCLVDEDPPAVEIGPELVIVPIRRNGTVSVFRHRGGHRNAGGILRETLELGLSLPGLSAKLQRVECWPRIPGSEDNCTVSAYRKRSRLKPDSVCKINNWLSFPSITLQYKRSELLCTRLKRPFPSTHK